MVLDQRLIEHLLVGSAWSLNVFLTTVKKHDIERTELEKFWYKIPAMGTIQLDLVGQVVRAVEVPLLL